MKLQYFGDRRDFYKYDLLLDLGRSLRPKGGITVIPMLTPDDGGPDGKLRCGVGRRDAALYRFLESCPEPTIGSVADHFKERGLPMKVTSEEHLLAGNRATYFAAVEDRDLVDTIVFLDPDNGLEVPSGRGTKYLRYEELRDLLLRMSDSSVIVVYQHMPREEHGAFFHKVSRRLFERSAVRQVAFLDMGDLAFIVLARSPEGFREVSEALGAYARIRDVKMAAATMSPSFGERPAGDDASTQESAR